MQTGFTDTLRAFLPPSPATPTPLAGGEGFDLGAAFLPSEDPGEDLTPPPEAADANQDVGFFETGPASACFLFPVLAPDLVATVLPAPESNANAAPAQPVALDETTYVQQVKSPQSNTEHAIPAAPAMILAATPAPLQSPTANVEGGAMTDSAKIVQEPPQAASSSMATPSATAVPEIARPTNMQNPPERGGASTPDPENSAAYLNSPVVRQTPIQTPDTAYPEVNGTTMAAENTAEPGLIAKGAPLSAAHDVPPRNGASDLAAQTASAPTSLRTKHGKAIAQQEQLFSLRIHSSGPPDDSAPPPPAAKAATAPSLAEIAGHGGTNIVVENKSRASSLAVETTMDLSPAASPPQNPIPEHADVAGYAPAANDLTAQNAGATAAPLQDAAQQIQPETMLAMWKGPDKVAETTAHTPPGPNLAQGVMPTAAPSQQISAAIAQFSREQPGQMELTLTPETLGRVHFDMRPDGTGLAITLSAERPETLDLIRRHLPDLLAELKQAGVQAGHMSFGSWNEDRQPRHLPMPDAPLQTTAEAPPQGRITPLPTRPATHTGGLNIRL